MSKRVPCGRGGTVGDYVPLQHPEAPHLYEIAGTWYLVIAEGGTERGHAVSIARGPTPAGPFAGHPGNPVLNHRSTDHPAQKVGHADFTRTADGRVVGPAARRAAVRDQPRLPRPGTGDVPLPGRVGGRLAAHRLA